MFDIVYDERYRHPNTYITLCGVRDHQLGWLSVEKDIRNSLDHHKQRQSRSTSPCVISLSQTNLGPKPKNDCWSTLSSTLFESPQIIALGSDWVDPQLCLISHSIMRQFWLLGHGQQIQYVFLFISFEFKSKIKIPSCFLFVIYTMTKGF